MTTRLEALDKTLELLNALSKQAHVCQNAGIDLFALACQPKPAKTPKGPTGLPDDMVEQLDARNSEGGPPHNDPTGEAAMRAESEGRKRLMNSYMEGLLANSVNLVALVQSGMPDRIDPRKRDQLNAANEQHCYSCARTKGTNGEPRASKPVGGPTDLKGKLAHKVLLCQQCREQAIRRHHEGLPAMPTVVEVEHRWTTGKWPPLKVPA